MGLITAAIVVGAAAVGASAYSQARGAKKARRSAEADMRRQKTQMRESMSLEEVRDDTGADIELGSDGDTSAEDSSRRKRRVARKQGETGVRPPPKTGGLNWQSALGTSLFGGRDS